MPSFTPKLKQLLRDAECSFERQGKGDHEIWFSPSAALLHNNLILMLYYSLPYHRKVLQNAPKGLVLIVFRPLNGKQ